MSIEERLRDSLRHQAGSPPPVRDLADRSLQRASRVRRTQAAAGALAVALIAVVVPWQLSTRQAGTADGVTATPSLSSGAASMSASASAGQPSESPVGPAPSTWPLLYFSLPTGAMPKVQFLLNERLLGPLNAAGAIIPGGYQQVLATDSRTIALHAGTSESEIVVIQADGGIKVVKKEQGEILGIAADASRVAYSVRTAEGNGIRVDLVLIDVATGNVVQRIDR
ncbi:MAG: hypothetical protein ABIM89_12230, partial [Mycobacteriales bacterium]